MSALLFLLVLSGCGGPPPEGAPGESGEEEVQPDPRALVEAAAVTRGSVRSHLSASATVESESQATLVPEATGVVTAIHAEEGDRVRKGQLLAVIANPTLEGGYDRASAELARAEREVEGARRLAAQGALSRAELDAAEGAWRSAKSAFEEATRTRGFTRLESPVEGVVASRSLRFGEVASPQAAFVVVDPDRLRVVINLPERDLGKVHAGQSATLTSAYDDTVKAAGVVARVSPVVDSASGTFRVTVNLTPGQAILRPGQFVTVQIEVDRHDDVLAVPRRAVVWEEGKPYLYQVVELTAEELAKEAEDAQKGDEAPKGGFSFSFGGAAEEEKKEEPLPGVQRKVSRLAVEIGFEDGELAEVKSGVVEGAQVVVVGNEALRDGARVRLPGDPVRAPKKDEPKDAPKDKADGAAPTGDPQAGDKPADGKPADGKPAEGADQAAEKQAGEQPPPGEKQAGEKQAGEKQAAEG